MDTTRLGSIEGGSVGFRKLLVTTEKTFLCGIIVRTRTHSVYCLSFNLSYSLFNIISFIVHTTGSEFMSAVYHALYDVIHAQFTLSSRYTICVTQRHLRQQKIVCSAMSSLPLLKACMTTHCVRSFIRRLLQAAVFLCHLFFHI